MARSDHIRSYKKMRLDMTIYLYVTGPPHPLAGSVERPRGGVHRHDVAGEVSSVHS